MTTLLLPLLLLIQATNPVVDGLEKVKLAQGTHERPQATLQRSSGGGSKLELQNRPQERPGENDISSLALVRRVYVDKFGGGAAADHLREMLIGSLQNSRLFIITEDQNHADAILKGSAEADTFKDVHITSEHANQTRRSARSSSLQKSGVFSTHEQSNSSNDSSGGEGESSRIEERRHEASAAVRLVLKNGDVVWSTTQESLGAKFRGASADVADKISRQLASDWQKAKREE